VHFLHMIQDAAIVLHGPRNCAWLMSYAWERDQTHTLRLQHRDVADNLYSTGMDMGVVFGGDRDALQRTVRRAYDDGFRTVFVVMTCTSEIIGTDLVGECERIDLPGLRVVPVMPDRKSLSSKFGGQEGAMRAVASLIDRERPVERDTVLVVYPPRIKDWAEDAADFEELLAAYGLRAKTYLPGWNTVEEIEDLAACEYMVVFARGITSRLFRDVFGERKKVLLAEPLNGIRGVREWCSMLSKATGRDGGGYLERTEALYEESLRPYREALSGKRAVIYNMSYMHPNALIDTLYDLGMEVPAYISWPDSLGDVNEKVERHPEVPRITDVPLCALGERCREFGADIILSRNPLTGNVGLPWVGAHTEHVGRRTALALARKMCNALKVAPKPAWRR